MTLAVKHLNADSTFLLSFTPAFAPPGAAVGFPGSFRILVDPWLSGHSSIWSPTFQISHHTSSPCIQSLCEIEEPDLVIISQDKPDHCHKETLCTLPRDTRLRILATPAAAKKIRSWKHFTHATIESLSPYSLESKNSLVRIPIPAYSARSEPGEVTISYLPQKLDLTALHNAIGITYREPGTTTITPSGSVVNLPLSRPDSAPTRPLTPRSDRSTSFFVPFNARDSLLTPPESPTDNTGPISSQSQSKKTLSVLYSPHGVSYTAIAPYTAYLAKESALPLTALFHSINIETNPWFMGGVVAAGYPGGEEIVRQLGAQYWISAHDEVKDNQGLSVAWIKSTSYTVENAQQKLDETLRGMQRDARRSKTVTPRPKIISMDSGDFLRIP